MLTILYLQQPGLIMSEQENNVQYKDSFGEFELQWQPQKAQRNNCTESRLSLTQLEQIYKKGKSSKRKSELEQIKSFNILQPERKVEEVKTAHTIESHSLLNQTEPSVKTVPEIYIELSCTAHIFAVLINAYFAQHFNFIGMLVYSCQVGVVIVNIMHLYKKLNLGCVIKRCNFIKLHIVSVFLAFLALCSLIVGSPRQFYLLVVLVIDGFLVNKLRVLHGTQVNMDADVNQPNRSNDFEEMMESSQL